MAITDDHPRLLTFVTNPKGQVITAILILCAILLFNSFFYVFRPYDGIGVYQEAPLGEVFEVVPGGPADLAGVRAGDQLLAIDGKPIDPLRNEPRYRPGIKPGDTVGYEFKRQNEQISLPLTIGSYSENLPLLSSYLGIQILSIGLWVIGLVLTLFPTQDDVRARLLSLGFLMAGLTAAVGGASGWNSFWGANTIQKVLLSLLAPVIVAAHLTFPSVTLPRYRKRIISLVFALAVLLAILVMIIDWILKPRAYPSSVTAAIYIRQAVFVFFMLSWLVAVALLIRNRFLSGDPEIRRQTGIVIWGMMLGLGPFFTFTLLPYVLFGQEYLAGAYTILFLLLLPLAYAYVIFQRKLLKVDFIINRIVVWFTLILLILIASILIFGLLVLLFQLPSQLPLLGGIVAVLIALPFTSLSKVVQAQVDRVLYGSHYDFATVTSSLAEQLAQPLDRNRLVELLTQHLPQQMGIQQAALFLAEGNRLELAGADENQVAYPLMDELCQSLLKVRHPVRAAQLWIALSSNAQTGLKEFEWGQVYAPLIAESRLQGVLILGQRASGDVYSDLDLRIIATVAEQGALAATNLRLVETLRGLAQQLVRSEEEQRKRLASDLHDTVLQELFFIKQGLHKDPNNPELLDYLEGLIQNMRRMIKAQRPPLLDQGLPLALQGLVEDMQKRAGSSTSITWQNSLDGTLLLSDEQATSIFRIVQEALNNAVKHARARCIEVKLEQVAQDVIRLQVKDDGIGASGTGEDGRSDQNHFGWVLMRERATMIGAELKIHSHPGEGTTVVLEVRP
jgi:two-component system sensor histidine kinase ComP